MSDSLLVQAVTAVRNRAAGPAWSHWPHVGLAPVLLTAVIAHTNSNAILCV